MAEIGELDLDELALWIAWYEQHDPELRDDLRAGTIAAAIGNFAPFRSRRQPLAPGDFMPSLARLTQQREQDAERHLLAWCANVGGEVKKG